MESIPRKKLIKSEVIHLFKTTKETLRHYEEKGLLTPEIDDKKYRYYDVEDMKRLRQIFMFRDLGFSIDQIKVFIDGGIEKQTYTDLLAFQNDALMEKIKDLQSLQQKTEQLLELLGEDAFEVSFRIKKFKVRKLSLFDPFNSPFIESMKAYYDMFKELIVTDFYTECSLMSLFDYDALSSFEKESSKMCIEITDEFLQTEDQENPFETLVLEEGLYLSVFYIFNEGDFSALSEVKVKIDRYLECHELRLRHQEVLEIEHPELSVSLADKQVVYEMQLCVEKKYIKNNSESFSL